MAKIISKPEDIEKSYKSDNEGVKEFCLGIRTIVLTRSSLKNTHFESKCYEHYTCHY